MQISSLLSYVAFLFMGRSYAESVEQRYLAAIMFAALLLILVEVAREFSLRDLPVALARR